MDAIQQNFSNATVAATTSTPPPPTSSPQRKRRRQQIADDEDVEVIALSVEEIKARKLFFCQFCDKYFIREQNLILHGKAHDLPNVRLNRTVTNNNEKRMVYVCPVTTCTHHNRPNALSDLTGLRKHYNRKHGEKTFRCTKCVRTYAVHSDLRAHLKVCGTKEYVCECGSSFSRRDSYLAHKVPCDGAVSKQLSLLRNESQTNQVFVGRSLFAPTTTDNSNSSFNNQSILSSNIAESHANEAIVGNFFVQTTFDDSISFVNNQPILSSNPATSMDFPPFLSDAIVAPDSLPNLSSSNQSTHLNITATDLTNNNSIQDTELNNDIFDIQILHDKYFGFSSVPTNVMPPEVPQQQFALADSRTSTSFSGSLKSSTAFCPNVFSMDPNFSSTVGENSRFPVFESLSGTYENQNQLRYEGNNISDNIWNLQRDYRSSTIVNDNIFCNSLEDRAKQTHGPPELDADQINQEQLWSSQRGERDIQFPRIQDDSNFWDNERN